MADLPSKKIRDIRGERFGRLLVESFSHIAENKGKNAYWVCMCDCGTRKTISSGSLRSGCTTSCGCFVSETSRELIKKTHILGEHLYLIRCGDFVKIGRADNPVLRLSQIQTANPYEVSLIRTFPNKGYKEKELHVLFKDKLHKGEWFSLTDEEVVSVGRVTE